MDLLKRCIMTGTLATLFVAGVAEAKTKATISGPVQVTEAKAGGSAAALLTDDVAKAAVETKLAWAEACGEVPAGQTQSYKATLEVDGNGAVTAVTRGEFNVSAEIASCLDGLLREVKTAALPTPEAAVKIVVELSLAGDAVAPAAPIAAPAAAAALEADIKAGEQKVAEHKEAAKEEAKEEAKAEAKTTEKKPEGPTKPWRVNAMLNFSVGNGSFIKDSTVNSGFAGYDLRFGGSYDLSEMFRAGISFQMAQELSATAASAGTIPREFYFGETVLNLSTRKLYVEEKYTGIKLNANVGIALPTAKAALAAERIMGLTIGGKVDKVFENVGPGSLNLNWTVGFRENLGPRAQTYSENKNFAAFALCRQADKVNCIGPANTARTLSNVFNLSYSFLEKWSATVTLGWINNFKWDVSDNADPTFVAAVGGPVKLGTSPNATPGAGHTDLVIGNIDLGYQITDMFSVSAGLYTAGDPFIYDNGKYSLRFPFWDAATPALNLSTIYLNFGFVY